MQHVCDFKSAWPVGHPLPPEDPSRLTGPEVGATVRYVGRYPDLLAKTGGIATVIERSYVWSPGECRSKGGYRHYDWSVIEWAGKTMCVNDTDLEEIA